MVLELYPPEVYGKAPSTFGEEVDAHCNAIHEAVKGFGTDEKKLIAMLADESPEMRYKISLRYKQLFEKDLADVIKGEVRGDLGYALQLLTLPIHQAEAMMLHHAMKGLGTKESCLYPILCGRTNKEMEMLKDTYFQMYEKDLGVKLAGELRGDFERLIFWSIQGHEKEFDPTVHTAEQAKEDAIAFYDAGSGKFGTNERNLFKIISESPKEHLENVNKIYIDRYERSLMSALGDEMKGDVAKGSMYMVGMKLKPYVTIARLIKDASRGMGTNEDLLTETIIRYQRFLKEVNEEHKENHGGMTIQDRIKDECKGKYEKLLLAVVDSSM